MTAFVYLFIFLIWLCPPLALLIGSAIVSYWAGDTAKFLKGTMDDFWLTPGEKEQFKTAYANYQRADNAIQRANLEGIQAGISQNADGQWSLHSNLGKEIRSTIELNAGPRAQELGKVRFWGSLPIMRWMSFKDILIARCAFIVSLSVFVMGFLFWWDNVYPDFVSGIKSFCTLSMRYVRLFHIDLGPDPTEVELQFYGVMALVCSLLIGFMNPLFKGINPPTPYPEQVTPDNVDKFSGGEACAHARVFKQLSFEEKMKGVYTFAELAIALYVMHLFGKCG